MAGQLVAIQAFLSAGNPAAGAKFYTYAAGTTTPKAAYADEAGTVPLSNPVVCNASGVAVCWLKSGIGDYKFELKDSSGSTNLIRTIDNFTPNVDNILYLIGSDVETALAAAQDAQAAAELAQAAAETAQANAETAEANAETAETNAASSASAASTSASNASTSASTATTQAGIATTQAGIATTQAGIATTQATNAGNSAAAAAADAIEVAAWSDADVDTPVEGPAGDTVTFDPSTALNTTTDVFTIVGHTFENDWQVTYRNGGGTSIAGLTHDAEYWIVGVSGDDFQLSATRGGSAINTTDQGAGSAHELLPLRSAKHHAYYALQSDLSALGHEISAADLVNLIQTFVLGSFANAAAAWADPNATANVSLYYNTTSSNWRVLGASSPSEYVLAQYTGDYDSILALLDSGELPPGVIASQAQAEAGTDNAKGVTPLRARQAIDYDRPSTLSALQARDAASGNYAYLRGRSAAGDGGKGEFIYNASDLSSTLIFSTAAVTAIGSNQVTCGTHNARTGDGFISSAASGGFSTNTLYYARRVSSTIVTAHPTFADAIANTNTVTLSSASGFNLLFLNDPTQAKYVIKSGNALDGTNGAWVRQHNPGVHHLEWFPGTFNGTADDASAWYAAARLMRAEAGVDGNSGVKCFWFRSACQSPILDNLTYTSGMVFSGYGPEISRLSTSTDNIDLFKFLSETDVSTPPRGCGVKDCTLESTVQYPTGGSLLSIAWENLPVCENIEFYGGYVALDLNRVANPVFLNKLSFFTGSRLGLARADIRLHSDSATKSNSSVHLTNVDMLHGSPESSRLTVTTNDDVNDELDFGAPHGLSDGAMVAATLDIAGLTAFDIYYAKSVASQSISLHPTRADAIAGTNKVSLTASSGFDLAVVTTGIPLACIEVNNGDGIYLTANVHMQGARDDVLFNPSANDGSIRRIYSFRSPGAYADACLRHCYNFDGDADTSFRYAHIGGEVATAGLDGVHVETDDELGGLLVTASSVRNHGRAGVYFANNNAISPRIFAHEYRNNNTGAHAAGGDIVLGGSDPTIGGDPHFLNTTTAGSAIRLISGASAARIDAPRAKDSTRTIFTNDGNVSQIEYLNIYPRNIERLSINDDAVGVVDIPHDLYTAGVGNAGFLRIAIAANTYYAIYHWVLPGSNQAARAVLQDGSAIFENTVGLTDLTGTSATDGKIKVSISADGTKFHINNRSGAVRIFNLSM